MTFQSFNSVHPSDMCCALLSCFCVCEWGSLQLISHWPWEREEKRTPLFSNSLKETLRTGSVQSTAHKGKEGVWGLLLEPKVKHGTDYQTHYWGKYLYFRAFSALVPFNLWAENAWNFISNWASQSGYVISYATDVYQCPAIGKIAIYDV